MSQHSLYLEERASPARVWLRRLLFALALLVIMIASAFAASDFDRGNEAYVDGMYAEAAQFWQRGADRGDGLSQFNLAVLYEHGNGLPQDFSKAIFWYRKAANQNVMSAQNNLANIFLTGTTEIPRSVNKAVYWYLKAADLGHADSQFKLASLLMEGIDGHLDIDFEAAESWLTVAARNGHLEAQATLDRLHREMEAERFSHVRGESWVSGQPDVAWTVELYSAQERLEALTYVEAIGLGDAAVVSDTSARFVVLAGVFESEQQARAAIRDLPPQLRARLPRVRQFGDVKAGMSVSASSLPQEVTGSGTQNLEITEYAQDGTASTRALYTGVHNAASNSASAATESEVRTVAPPSTLVSEELAELSRTAVSKRQVEITEERNSPSVDKPTVWSVLLQEAERSTDINMSPLDHSLSDIWLHESAQDGRVRLLMGQFADRESAEIARGKLPVTVNRESTSVVDLNSF